MRVDQTKHYHADWGVSWSKFREAFTFDCLDEVFFYSQQPDISRRIHLFTTKTGNSSIADEGGGASEQNGRHK